MQDPDQHSVGTLLCRLGGADTGVLKLAPKARREYIALAVVLLATASIAVLSMTFAMTDGLKVPLAAAAVIGLFWGAVILSIDRALIINLKPKGRKLRLLVMIIPRIVMAALLGFVISMPLTLRIFEDEIAEQMTRDQIASANKAEAELRSGGLQASFDAKDAEVKKYEAILAGNYTYTAPTLAQAQQEYETAKAGYEAKQREAETAYRKWQCELYGVGCELTSGVPGNGNLARALEREYNNRRSEAAQAKSVMDGKQQALLAAQTQNKTDAEGALATAKAEATKQLAILVPQRDELREQLQTLNDKAQGERKDGLLAQLVALDHLGAENGMARTAHLLVAALFFMIELLPVAIKTLSALGPASVYERADKFDDDRILERAAAKAKRDHLKQEDLDKEAIRSEVRVAQKVQARVEEVVTDFAMTEVDRWSRDVRKSAAAYAKQSQGQYAQGQHSQGGQSPGGPGGVWHPQTAPQQPGPYNLPPKGNPSRPNPPYSAGGGSQP